LSALLPLLLLAAAQAPSPAAAPAGKAAERPVASEENPYAATFAAEGTGTDTFVYLHNRKGVRVELNLDKRALDLWISPRAGTSVDYRDRNFSNRDDHTSIFDRISLPRLERKDFLRCDYDPFHSVLRFKGQTLHLATLFDRPVVLLWFESPSVVDLKTDKQDRFLVGLVCPPARRRRRPQHLGAGHDGGESGARPRR
jgi:hypothetical protein